MALTDILQKRQAQKRYESKPVRLSVRLVDTSQERVLLKVDIGKLNSVEEFIKHVTKVIDPPIFTLPQQNSGDSKATHNEQEQDQRMTIESALNEEQKILVLEPDIIVNDIDSLESGDQVLVTTMSNLIQIERQLD